MAFLRFLKNTKPSPKGIARTEDRASFWETQFLTNGIPLLLGIGLAILLAYFITGGSWPFVLGLLLLVPAVILFNSYPFAAVILWLLVTPFLQTTPNDPTRMMYWMMHRALPPLALIAIIPAYLFKDTAKRPRIKLGRADLAMVMFLGLAALNILMFHPSEPLPFLYILYDRVFVAFCLHWAVRFTAPREQDMKRLIPIALALVIIEGAVGIVSWLRPEMLPPDWVGSRAQRGIGTMQFAHAYSTALVFFSLLLFHAAMNLKSGILRSALLFAIGLGTIGVFFSFSRGSWLGGLAAAAGLLFLHPKPMLRLALIVIIVVSLLGNTIFAQQLLFAQERMNSEDTAKVRWVIWGAGLHMIQAKPFFGWGFGNYNDIAWQFQTRVFNFVASRGEASHNSFISIAGELGVPALLIYLFPTLWWLWLSLKIWPRLPRKGFWSNILLVTFWLALLDQMIAGFFSDMRTSMYGSSMWWVTLGLIANMVETYLQPRDMHLPTWLLRSDEKA